MVIFKTWFIWPDFHIYDCLSLICSGGACFSQDKNPKLQWMLRAPIKFMGWHLHSEFEHLHLSGFQKRDAPSPFALCIISFSRWFDLISPRFLCDRNSLPEEKKKITKTPNFPAMHRHIFSVLMHVLCQVVKPWCVTVYTSTPRAGLGCKRNVLILVPFANRGKLLHMSSGSEVLVWNISGTIP